MMKVQNTNWRRSAVMLMVLMCSIVFVSGDPKVLMSPSGEVNFSINFNLTVITTLLDGSGRTNCELFLQNLSTNAEVIRVGYLRYTWDTPADDSLDTSQNTNITFSSYNLTDKSRVIEWHLGSIMKSENHLNLTSKMTVFASQTMVAYNFTVLHVQSCDMNGGSSQVQSSDAIIQTESHGHFGDEGNCSCPPNQVPFNTDGSLSHAKATCGQHAEWLGCEDVQCWWGPQNISAIQLNTTVNAAAPFACNFTQGFPYASAVAYRIDNVIISSGYVLKSYDNAKNLSCEISTLFTEVINGSGTSPYTPITVFYPPENSSLSSKSIAIGMNETFDLNYTFFVNPLPQGGGVQITIQGGPWSSYSGLFSLKHNYSRSTHRIYEIQVNVTSHEDYGDYNICSSTERPPGKDCTTLTILKVVAPIPTFSVTTNSRDILDNQLSDLAIGLIVLGLLLPTVITVSVSFYVCRRRKGSLQDGNTINDPNVGNTEYAVYGPTKGPEPIPNSEQVELHEPNPGYELVKPNSGYEEVVLHEQSSGYDEVQTCDQNMHYEEITTQRSNTGYESVMHSAGYENVVIHASYERVE